MRKYYCDKCKHEIASPIILTIAQNLPDGVIACHEWYVHRFSKTYELCSKCFEEMKAAIEKAANWREKLR